MKRPSGDAAPSCRDALQRSPSALAARGGDREGGEATFNQDPRFSELTLPLPVQVKGALRAHGER